MVTLTKGLLHCEDLPESVVDHLYARFESLIETESGEILGHLAGNFKKLTPDRVDVTYKRLHREDKPKAVIFDFDKM